MAHVALVVDPDPARRERFVADVGQLFADLPGTTVAEASHGPRSPQSLARAAPSACDA